MCGRYTLHLPDLTGLAGLLGVQRVLVPDWRARYNIAPTQPAPIARTVDDQGTRVLEQLRFGLPARERSGVRLMINARVETVASLPLFRSAYASRRCVVPASGFYEWKAVGGKRKQTIWVHPTDADLMVFAGIFEEPRTGDDAGGGFAILTCDASDALATVHDRMPLILGAEDVDRWLGDEAPSRSDLVELVTRARGAKVELRAVGSLANSPVHDEPRCIAVGDADAEDGEQLELFGV
jgi:putative SOS response-associated peptidase YedK